VEVSQRLKMVRPRPVQFLIADTVYERIVRMGGEDGDAKALATEHAAEGQVDARPDRARGLRHLVQPVVLGGAGHDQA
jgi:hypothetical protein